MEWISVKDRLPDNDDLVLFAMYKFGNIKNAGGQYLGFYANGHWEIDSEQGYGKDANNNVDYWLVTHWMPLPDSPTINP